MRLFQACNNIILGKVLYNNFVSKIAPKCKDVNQGKMSEDSVKTVKIYVSS